MVRRMHQAVLRRSDRLRWLPFLLAVWLGIAPTTAGGQASNLGGFVAVASAQAVRVSYDAEGFLIVRSLFDSGGPVSQAVVNSIDGQSFASLPYPGETMLAGPGLIAANGGPALPAYPFFVSASSTNPEQKFSDPSNLYSIAASVAEGQATGDAKIGAGGQDALATGQRTFANAGSTADEARATAETTVEGITLGGGALRIASIRSRSVTTFPSGASKPQTVTELVVEGGRAGSTSFAYGPEGLTVANGGIPLPAGQGIDAINQALAPAGITIRFVGGGDVPGGRSSGALEVAQAGPLPTGGQGLARLQFGAASTGITIGGADSALASPVPESPAESSSGTWGGSNPAGPSDPVEGASSSVVSESVGGVPGGGPIEGVAGGGYGSAGTSSGDPLPVSGGTLASGESGAGSLVAGGVPVTAEGSAAVPVYRLRKSASVGAGYAIVLVTAVLLFLVGSIWRRGSLTL